MMNFNPLTLVMKCVRVELGIAAAPLVPSLLTGAAAAALPVTAAATGLVTTAGAIGAVGGASLFSGSLLSNLSTGFSIASTLIGGQQEAAEYKQQAEIEKFNATNREIERKRNLVRALSLQNVRAATSGFTSGVGSSAQAIQLEDIKRSDYDETVAAAGTNLRVNQLRQNAKSATQYSLLSAASEGVSSYRRKTRRGAL